MPAIYAAILLPTTCLPPAYLYFFYVPACLVESVSTRGFSSYSPQHQLTAGRGLDTLTQANAIAADTSRCLLRSFLPASIAYRSIHSRALQHMPVTCQHRSARPILCPRLYILTLIFTRTRRLLFEGASMHGWRGR